MKAPFGRPSSDPLAAAQPTQHGVPSSPPEAASVPPVPECDGAVDDDCDAPADDEDAKWDAFLADDDELDPLPGPGDFWLDQD
jgi:hypothetical protein